MLASGQQDFRLLDAPLNVIAMRRHAERLLESATEIIRAQPHQLRERRERNLLGQMFVDVPGHDALLPRGEPAAEMHLRTRGAAIETDQFVDQNDPERLDIKPAFDARRLDRLLDLRGRAPDRWILEE